MGKLILAGGGGELMVEKFRGWAGFIVDLALASFQYSSMNETRFQRVAAANDQADDFQEIVVDGYSARVFRPIFNGVRRPNFYVKGYPPGRGNRAFYRCTGYAKKAQALEAARKLWRGAVEGRWEALEKTKLRGEARVATVGELIAAHERGIARVNRSVQVKSAAGYRNSLRRVVAWGKLGGLGRVEGRGSKVEVGGSEGKTWQDRAEALPGTVLDGELVRDYLLAVVPAKEANPKVHEVRLRGALRTLALARQMFSAQTRECFKGVALPPKLEDFLKRPAEKAPRRQHEALSDEAMRAMSTAALALRTEQPALYAVHLLFRHLGMRNDEIANARVEWIERLAVPKEVFLFDGSKRRVAAFMHIVNRDYWAVKKSGGKVPMAAEVLAEIDAACGGEGCQVVRLSGDSNGAAGAAEDGKAFLIPALTPTARWDLVNLAHNDFVRSWTGHLQKRSYELRRWAGTKVRMLHRSREMGDVFLRHAPTSVGELNYFTDAPVPAPITLSDVGLTVPPAAD